MTFVITALHCEPNTGAPKRGMGMFEPPRVNVDIVRGTPPSWQISALILGIAWIITLVTLMFISPTLSEGVVATMDQAHARRDLMLGTELVLDTLFVGLGAYWGITLSRLPVVPSAVLFGFGFLLGQIIEAGGLPGVIDTDFPLWYQLLGNVNDIVGALAAALVIHLLREADA